MSSDYQEDLVRDSNPIIHSGDSIDDSQSSISVSDSNCFSGDEGGYASSRTSGGHPSCTTITSRNGKVIIHGHEKSHYGSAAPLASTARSRDHELFGIGIQIQEDSHSLMLPLDVFQRRKEDSNQTILSGIAEEYPHLFADKSKVDGQSAMHASHSHILPLVDSDYASKSHILQPPGKYPQPIQAPESTSAFQKPILVTWNERNMGERALSDAHKALVLPSQSDIGQEGDFPPLITSDIQCDTISDQNRDSIKYLQSIPDDDLSSSSVSEYRCSESEQNESEGSSSDEVCEWFDYLHINGMQITLPTLDPVRQAMADRVMNEFWIIFNEGWPPGVRQHVGETQQPSASSRMSTPNSGTQSSQASRQKRRKVDGDDNSEGNEDDDRQPREKYLAAKNESDDIPRFACPFRKHDPCKYNVYSHRTCAQSHWPSISRVKEHIYRCHRAAIYCERCWQTFKDRDQLKEHITVDASLICTALPGSPPDGVTPDIERKLRSRKKTNTNQTHVDRWKDMYRILFVNEEVPSPYFEPPQEEVPMSSDSRDLADYEEYARRELPRLVRSSVLEVLSREMQPVEASLIANLVDTVRECQDRLFRSYLGRTNHGSESAITGTGLLAISQPVDLQQLPGLPPSHLVRPSSDLLDAAFQPPPPLQDMEFETNAYSFNSHMDNFHLPALEDDSLASFTDSMFSDFELNSNESCACLGPCSCTATTLSSQSWGASSFCP